MESSTVTSLATDYFEFAVVEPSWNTIFSYDKFYYACSSKLEKAFFEHYRLELSTNNFVKIWYISEIMYSKRERWAQMVYESYNSNLARKTKSF